MSGKASRGVESEPPLQDDSPHLNMQRALGCGAAVQDAWGLSVRGGGEAADRVPSIPGPGGAM